MVLFDELGVLDISLLEGEFGKIVTDEIIITQERIEHIKNHHPEDCNIFVQYAKEAVQKPDIIIKDSKNKGTAFMIKRLNNTNLNVVVRVVLQTDNSEYKNSVMTFYRIRDKNLEKLIKKNKIIYKKE